ncbi:MAG: T9SS type A sorting domain-containing protein [Elusimicrobiota bacterium]
MALYAPGLDLTVSDNYVNSDITYRYTFAGFKNITVMNSSGKKSFRSAFGSDITIGYTDNTIFTYSWTNNTPENITNVSYYPTNSSFCFKSTVSGITDIDLKTYPMTARPASGSAMVTVNKFDTSLDKDNVLVDFTADPDNDSKMDFVVGELKAEKNYLIKRAGENYQVVQANANKCIKFSNADWSAKTVTVEETDLPAQIVTDPEIDIGNPPPASTAPTAPQDLVAAAGEQQIAPNWQAPASDGGAVVTGYKIYRGLSSGAEVLLAEVGVNPAYTDLSVNGGGTYYYQVSAVNSMGEGNKSNEVMIVLPASTEVPKTSGEAINVYPNPYIKGKTSSEKIIFRNLAKESAIKIYTAGGNLAEELIADADGKAEWNVRAVRSGVYLYVVKSAEGVRKGKVSVLK